MGGTRVGGLKSAVGNFSPQSGNRANKFNLNPKAVGSNRLECAEGLGQLGDGWCVCLVKKEPN